MFHAFIKKLLLVAGLAFLIPSFVFALQDGAARTPPMGFNTWNYFGCNGCNQTNVIAVMNAMLIKHPANWEGKSINLMDAGYKYINLDDCWELGSTRTNDTLHWDPTRFPKGLPWLADTLHSRGFELGIYSCCGTQTCAGRPASYGYEAEDAYTFVKWGITYLKEDWCYTPANANAPSLYSKMGHGIVDAQKKLGIKSTFVFSLCNWGVQSPWLFGDTCGHLWRTTGDIGARFSGSADGGTGGGSVQSNFLNNSNHWQNESPGNWNDPDMLEVGNSLTDVQGQSHFDLWCISAAPLIMGNNTPAMSEQTFTTLSNREIIAVDQDSLGHQGHRVLGNGTGVDMYVKLLKSPDTVGMRIAAVCVVNWSGSQANGQAITWANLGEKVTTQSYTVRDLHTHTNLSTTASGTYTTAAIPAYGTQMLLFTSNSYTGINDGIVSNNAKGVGKLQMRMNANALEFYVSQANSVIQVFNLSGKKVIEFSALTANWYKINGSILPGTYIVRINGGNHVSEGKLPLFAK